MSGDSPSPSANSHVPAHALDDAGASPRELLAAGALLLALLLLPIALFDAWILFSKPLWLDEYHTLFLAGRETFVESMRSLARGSDYNPPLLFVLVRGLGVLTGGLNEVILRSFAFASVWGALLVVYATLRRDVDRSVAFVATLALATHALVMRSAFDGRFYGPWLFFTALFAYLMTDRPPAGRGRWRDLGIAISAAALCSIHYYGIITWGLVTAAVVAQSWQGVRETARHIVPALAGPIALAAFFPLLLSQRAALTGRTWVPPVSAEQLGEFIDYVYITVPLAVVAAALVFALVRDRIRGERMRGLWPGIVRFSPLLVLALLPAILVVFSATVQPSLIPRYALPGVLFLAPAAALAASRGGRTVVIALGCIFVFYHARLIYFMGYSARSQVNQLRAEVNFLASTDPETPILVVDRYHLYPLHDQAPGLRARLWHADLPDSIIREQFPLGAVDEADGDFLLVERDVARIHRTLYGLPQLIDPSRWPAGRPVLVHGRDGEDFVRRFLPGAQVRKLTRRTLEVVPPEPGSHPEN